MTPLFVIAFFTVGKGKGFGKDKFGNLPKDKNGPTKPGINEADKAWKKFLNANGPIDQNIDLINSVMETICRSNSAFKTGNFIAGIVDHTYNSLINSDKDKLTIGHVNSKKSAGERRIWRTKAYMGAGPNKELKSFLNAPFYKKKTVLVRDSQQDWLEESRFRDELKIKCGINERGISFLGEETFLTVDDVLVLSDYDKDYVKKVKEALKTKLEKFGTEFIKNKTKNLKLDDVIDEGVNFAKKKLFTDKSNVGYTKHFTGIIGTTCKFKVENRMPVYDANIAIHLVKLKNTDSELNSVSKIAKNLVVGKKKKTASPYLERITEEELYTSDLEKNKPVRLMHRLTTDLKVNPTRLESFKENCILVKTWRRTLAAGDFWYLDIHEKFKDGVYLNQIEELRTEKNNFDEEMPVSYFLMIEFYGDPKAAVFRKRDEETISSIYSPCLLSCELDYEVHFISKTDKRDNSICYERTKETKLFEENELLEQSFYPERSKKFHVEFDNIAIGDGKNQQKQDYRLELSSSILENQNMSLIESLASKIKKLDPDSADNLTEDDIPFLNPNNSGENDIDDDDPNNLRGNKKGEN